MKNILAIQLLLLLTASFSKESSAKQRVLVFSKTAVFYHKSINAGIRAIYDLGRQNSFEVDTTTNSNYFTGTNLKKYNAVIFLNTTGDVLNEQQQQAFENYIKNGGGFVGIHAAADCEYNWNWYGRLVGGYFESHPKIQEAVLNIVDSNHMATRHLKDPWKRTDEWYNFKQLRDSVHVLITIDESSYSGGKNGSYHPMSWYQQFDGGRAFYTALGHTEESFSDPLYLKHLLGGIQYAISKKLKEKTSSKN